MFLFILLSLVAALWVIMEEFKRPLRWKKSVDVGTVCLYLKEVWREVETLVMLCVFYNNVQGKNLEDDKSD